MAKDKDKKQAEVVEVTISGVFAQYKDTFVDYAGETREIIRTAERGETVEMSAVEAARLRSLGVVEDPDTDALEATLARAVNPNDGNGPGHQPVPSVTPPSGGVAPVGDLLTGDTGGPDSQPVVTEVPGGDGGAADGAFDARGLEVVEVIEWLEEKSPNAADTVSAAQGDAAAAKVILEAEDTVSGGDPRATVVKPLQKIADGDSGE